MMTQKSFKLLIIIALGCAVLFLGMGKTSPVLAGITPTPTPTETPTPTPTPTETPTPTATAISQPPSEQPGSENTPTPSITPTPRPIMLPQSGNDQTSPAFGMLLMLILIGLPAAMWISRPRRTSH